MTFSLVPVWKNKLLKLATDEGLKVSFETSTPLTSFWIKVKAEYLELSEIALLLFPSTDFFETGFSTMSH